jgi:hypothetical protein
MQEGAGIAALKALRHPNPIFRRLTCCAPGTWNTNWTIHLNPKTSQNAKVIGTLDQQSNTLHIHTIESFPSK